MTQLEMFDRLLVVYFTVGLFFGCMTLWEHWDRYRPRSHPWVILTGMTICLFAWPAILSWDLWRTVKEFDKWLYSRLVRFFRSRVNAAKKR